MDVLGTKLGLLTLQTTVDPHRCTTSPCFRMEILVVYDGKEAVPWCLWR